MEFKVDDIVEAFGVKGKIIGIYSRLPAIHVEFSTDYTRYFTTDGKVEVWHKEPSLKLIERPKKYKEITIETYGIVAQGYVIHSDDKLFIESSFNTSLGLNPDNKKIKVTYYVEDKE